MNAAEFERRMDQHRRDHEESMRKHAEFHAAVDPVVALYSRLIGGVQIKHWRVTPSQADHMDAILGQHETILGYPVVVDGAPDRRA